MSSQPSTKSAGKPSKSTSQAQQNSSRCSSLSSHLAMVELKQKILTSLSKLADRDTYQIAIEDLEKTVQTLSQDSLPMFLNCLYESSNDPKPAVKKESLRLLGLVCQLHTDLSSTHVTKIISHIVKRLKDSDSGVKDACRDAIGLLSKLYLNGTEENSGSVVMLFVKPLLEAMNEQNKGVQSGASMCLAKMVECASDPPVAAFQKLCPRICKLLNNQNFLAKASLLPVVGSLSQVGAIGQQSVEPLLQTIHECLVSTDWVTRKAAADALSVLAMHSSNLVTDGASSTLAVLEAYRFDKIKPVRDSMTEALQLWKKIAGKGDAGSDDQKACHDGDTPALAKDSKNSNPSDRRSEPSAKGPANGLSPTSDSLSKGKGGGISHKAVVILKKKAPVLTDKELNPEFFQKLETRGSGDLPVEVVVPRRFQNISNSNNVEELGPNDLDLRGRSNRIGNMSDEFSGSHNSKNRSIDRGTAVVSEKDPKLRASDVERESSGNCAGFSKTDGQSEGSFINNKGNWLAIQRQLMQLERQQGHLMSMLQDFMGGSHNSMVTLENRVRGLERIVEDMAQDLSISSSRRGSNSAMGFEGSANRPLGKYHGFTEYSGAKYNGRGPFGERFAQSDGLSTAIRGRGTSWRSEMSDAWDFQAYGASRNGQVGSRRAPGGGPNNVRSPKSEHESDQASSRRAWDKGCGPVRLGEGPSARSVWQASKDEATLEAIRVAGEDSGTSRSARVAIPEMTTEALGDANVGQERDPVWISWTNAMDALQSGDMDTAYAEVVSTGDDLLLVKLMDRSGPVIDQLSSEIANEVFHAIGQFLLEQNLFDICLSWIQQLVDIVLDNGPDVLGIPMELRKELLLNLHEASSEMDPPEEWEGVAPDQLLLQLASAWGIEPQQFEK
ncbi:microtubule-associated protein TORTIFOLIA1-like [Mangifera indica]|uniref:microtubule-associated protein TORTIFOLIA1-like n=1 Tax=Mangifera indica TaxID=29780 RepID=UPI001CFB90B4|nr:microtubule-associated protein TORTIFOLIA1-like [Mangifera indica]